MLLGSVGTTIIGFINVTILSRILTTSDMGKYSLFLMIANLGIQLGLSWSDSSIIRHGREEYIKRGKINQSFWARTYLFLPLAILFTLIFIIFSRQLTAYIGVQNKLIIWVITLFLLEGLLNLITCTFRSVDQMKKSAYTLFSQKLFYLICLGSLFYFHFAQDNLTIILILLNISFLVSLGINLYKFNFKAIHPYKFNKTYFMKIWRYSWPQIFGFSGLYIVNYIDLYFIRKYMTLSDVGIYNIAYNGFLVLCGIALLMNTIFMPLIVEYRTKKRFDLIAKYAKKIPLFSLIWIAGSAIAIILSKYFIEIVFSTKYLAAIPSFNILIVTGAFYFVSICFSPMINAFDFIIYAQLINITKAIVNAIADSVLVKQYGIIGAAYGTMISIAVALILVLILFYSKRRVFFHLDKVTQNRIKIAGSND